MDLGDLGEPGGLYALDPLRRPRRLPSPGRVAHSLSTP